MAEKYFLRANSAQGEVNLIYDNLRGINEIIIVEGKSGTAKKRFFSQVNKVLSEMGKELEGIMSPFDVGEYEGLIDRKEGWAIFDSRCAKNIRGEVINLDKCLKRSLELAPDGFELLWQKSKWAYENLHKSYADAKEIHDLWEKVYVEKMDFARLNSYCDGLIGQLIPSRRSSLEGRRRTGFFGASTPDGSVNYIGGITENIKNRYFIKGRPGTGKSTFLKKLAAQAEKNGYDTQVYYCSFDKNSLDMVVVRDLDFAVFDSTLPHQLFPEREGDSILDFYTEAGLAGTDEAYSDHLAYLAKLYSHKIGQGTAYLRLGLSFEKEAEFYYERAMDENEIYIAADKILRKLV